MIRGCRKQRRERGVAMVEFMIVLPVVLFIMFGVTEIGRVLIRYNTLTKALQDGARHASVYGLAGSTQVVNIDAALNNEIRNLVVYGNTAGTGTPLLDGLIPGQVTVTVPQAGWIQVDASYPYVPAMGTRIPSFGLGATPTMVFNLDASVTMRAL
ncbi:MAG TPA: TadE/TadG family type IV pilus assembly protein [Gammaproteobacteria bacterium]|jgi:Flp pilus assembly protein TadG